MSQSLSDFVTIDTNQTITGVKTYTTQITASSFAGDVSQTTGYRSATTSQSGVIKLGDGLAVATNGTINIGSINFRRRITPVNGVFNVKQADYCYTDRATVVLNTDNLANNEVFAIGTSLYAPIADFVVFTSPGGAVMARLPAGFIGVYRKVDVDGIACIEISSQLPSYVQAFVPTAIKQAVQTGTWNTANELTTTPANSEPSMRFFDTNYIYDSYLTAQVTNGVLTKTWIRTPKTTFTPSDVKVAVTGAPDTAWVNGELSGTQPAGSIQGMKFCDTHYRYEFMNGMNDMDGTTYVWVRNSKQ